MAGATARPNGRSAPWGGAVLAAAVVLAFAGRGEAIRPVVREDPLRARHLDSITSSGIATATPEAGGEPRLIFVGLADPGPAGPLWTSDGNPGGGSPVGTVLPGAIAYGTGLASFDGAAWFHAEGPDGSMWLFRTDGTPGGTRPIASTGRSMAESHPAAPVPAGGKLYFTGVPPGGGDRTLFVTDGTPGGSRAVRSDGTPAAFDAALSGSPARIAAGDRLFFRGWTAGEGSEPWVTDGTEDGTRLLGDLLPGPGDSLPSFPYDWFPVVLGETVFFAAEGEGMGVELWRSDGTAAGTVPVADLDPGPAGSSPLCLGTVGGRVVFSADDGVHGRGLWATDGTPDGTIRLPLTGLPEGPPGISTAGLGNLGGRLLFLAGNPGWNLGATDGTPGGTAVLGSVPIDGPLWTGPAFRVLPGTGVATFAGAGVNLDTTTWRTDGTPTGTFRVGSGIPLLAWKGAILSLDAQGTLLRIPYGALGVSHSEADDDGDGFSTELEEAVGSKWWDADDAPVGEEPAGDPDPLVVTRAGVRVDIGSSGRDEVTLRGRLPVAEGAEPKGRTVTVDAGGVIRTFVLDRRGRARGADGERFRLRVRRRGGSVREEAASPFRVRLPRGLHGDRLADEGLWPLPPADGEPRTLPVTVLWEGVARRARLPLVWTADATRRGRARLDRDR